MLTVDDDEAARRAARAVVVAAPGFTSVGEVASGEEAIEAVIELEPDLAIVDVDMPGLDGYETCQRLVAVRPRTVVILLSDGVPVSEPAREAAGAAAHTAKAELTPSALQGLWRDCRLG
ncbi:MAG TPA: response regulator [Thermoleophilaceae bacterium]|nr:response regulator [Thermoleophilaceae bacterium]